jgi:hypothetical protein
LRDTGIKIDLKAVKFRRFENDGIRFRLLCSTGVRNDLASWISGSTSSISIRFISLKR